MEGIEGGGVLVVAHEQDTSPGNDWTEDYLLLEVKGSSPLDSVRRALEGQGWEVREPEGGDLLLVADKPEAGLTLSRYSEERCGIPSEKCGIFREKAAGRSGSLFTVSVMPYV
ncbi:hypothetical protein [Streptomyces sp. KL2]|uniref:hypothetical protein n=1 Tax=Streptomyces sp. KL2 TaxID=3050126 RepID=UPI00397BF3EC